MMTADRALAAMAATWPPAAVHGCGPFLLREGQGGGSRVSAARRLAGAGPADVDRAIAAMRALGQVPQFQITPADDALDTLLAARGLVLRDPVRILAAPVGRLPKARPPQTAFAVWPPLAVQAGIWAAGGIGPARLAVMARPAVRTTILGRLGERAAGTLFVACDGDVAVVHALEVAAAFRRQGLARHLMAAAADWAGRQGAAHLALAVTRANGPAAALYAGLGMEPVADYHYRNLEG